MFPSQRSDYLWRLSNANSYRRTGSGSRATILNATQTATAEWPPGSVSSQSPPIVTASRPMQPTLEQPPNNTNTNNTQNLYEVTRKLYYNLPSSWSLSDQIKFQFDPQPWNLFNTEGNSVVDSQICLQCGTDPNGDLKKQKSILLSSKTEEERELFTRICKEAMKNRRKAHIFYTTFYENEREKSKSRLLNFKPEDHKAELCDLMLKLVIERDQLLNERSQRKLSMADIKEKKKNSEFSNNISPMDLSYSPVYCIKGKTIVARMTDSWMFPNTFAELSSLHLPKDDPPDFLRYSTLVDMRGFDNNELLIRVKGQILAVDGYKLIRPETKNGTPSVRVVTEYVKLPKGVYPERLLIGRSYSGILVIQEPWKF